MKVPIPIVLAIFLGVLHIVFQNQGILALFCIVGILCPGVCRNRQIKVAFGLFVGMMDRCRLMGTLLVRPILHLVISRSNRCDYQASVVMAWGVASCGFWVVFLAWYNELTADCESNLEFSIYTVLSRFNCEHYYEWL